MNEGRLTKVAASSLLVLVGLMGIGASAAQAKWVLVGGTEHTMGADAGKLLLPLTGEVLSEEMLIESLGIEKYCAGGTASASLSTNAAMTNLAIGGTATLEECTVLSFEETCTLKSIGQAVGNVDVVFNGQAKMSGASTSSELLSEDFSSIRFEGEECPFNELEAQVKGLLSLTLPNATESALGHTALLDEISIKYGEGKLLLHDGINATNPISMHMSKAGGGSWAIQLAGL